MLARTLAELLGRPVHASTVRRELPRLGLHWRRARPTLRIRHPDSAKRMKAINQRLAQVESGVEVFYIDEVDIDRTPKLASSGRWSESNRQSGRPGRTGNVILPVPCMREQDASITSKAYARILICS